MSKQPGQEDIVVCIENAASALEDIQSKITTIRELGDKQDRELKEKAATIHTLNERIQEFEAHLNTLKAEKDALGTEKEAMEVDLRKQLQETETQVRVLETEKVALTTEKEAIEADLQKQLQEITTQVQTLETEKETLIIEKDTLEADLQKQLQEIKAQVQTLEMERTALTTEKEAIEADLQKQLQETSTLAQTLEIERVTLATEKASLTDELKKKADDYDALLSQFESISSEFQAIREKEETSLDVRQLLSLYIALLEDIYAARPHIRILWLLHGEKGKAGMTREEVTKASGFEPIAVLKAIHDLVNTEFVEYDEETHQITLKRRIFG